MKNRVRVGDRLRRLSNGEAVGTVISVADDLSFTILLDAPTTKQLDKTNGRQKVKSLYASGMEICMSAEADRAGRRRLDIDDTARFIDPVAVRQVAMCEDASFEGDLFDTLAMFG